MEMQSIIIEINQRFILTTRDEFIFVDDIWVQGIAI